MRIVIFLWLESVKCIIIQQRKIPLVSFDSASLPDRNSIYVTTLLRVLSLTAVFLVNLDNVSILKYKPRTVLYLRRI